MAGNNTEADRVPVWVSAKYAVEHWNLPDYIYDSLSQIMIPACPQNDNSIHLKI